MNIFLGCLGLVFVVLLIILFFISIIIKRDLDSLSIIHQPNQVDLGNGEKTALIIYQPASSRSVTQITMALAEALVQNSYKVTVNFPSDSLNYDLSSYDLIAFGSGVFMGSVSSTLCNYMFQNKFRNKKVLIYTIGQKLKDTSDLSELKIQLDNRNDIYSIKLKKGQEAEMRHFVNEMLSK